ncbi:MAG: hypothetical protein HY329_14670, partial [Chloroflexi bacterium]|nr:hypothetical protein [Chloroflexota bacterium]
MPACTAHSKCSGRPCRNPAVAGKTVCRFHGGAPGSGGQPGKQNARVHDLYAHAVPEQYRELLAVAEELDGLREEIKLLCVRIAVAC